MRFNSVKRGNFSGLARSVNQNADAIFKAARDTAVDNTAIAKEAIKGRSMERRAAMEAEGKVARAGLEAVSKTKQYKDTANALVTEGKQKGKKARMAGVVGALGSLATGVVVRKDRAADKKDREEQALAEERRHEQLMAMWSRPRDKFQFDEEPPENPNVSTPIPERPEGSTPSSPSPSGSKPQQVSSTIPAVSGSLLTGVSKTLADAIAKYESGSHGYEAFNQGGEAGGTKIPKGFKSGNYQTEFGSSLTNKTIGEIMELQRDPGKNVMSDSEWVSSGKLHAVGRYQFIGPTLKDEVTRMGLDPNTKFTPEVQDKIFLSHIKRIGSISPWVGPMQHYSQAERNNFNSMISQL